MGRVKACDECGKPCANLDAIDTIVASNFHEWEGLSIHHPDKVKEANGYRIKCCRELLDLYEKGGICAPLMFAIIGEVAGCWLSPEER